MSDGNLQGATARPGDLITQREAAKLVNRSVDSIRRWRRDKGLEVWRDAHPTAKAYVSKAQVLALAGHVSPTPKVGKGDGVHASANTSNDALLAQREHIATLQALVDALSAQREGLVAQVSQLKSDMRAAEIEANNAQTRLERDNNDLRQRITSLEAELGSPVRALLGAGKRMFGK